jgi:hypothetical protein
MYIDYAKKYRSIAAQLLIYTSMSCSGFGYWVGVITGSLVSSSTEGISHYIFYAISSAIVALLSLYCITQWARFMLDRYVR